MSTKSKSRSPRRSRKYAVETSDRRLYIGNLMLDGEPFEGISFIRHFGPIDIAHCTECGIVEPGQFRVKDKLWLSVARLREFLCLDCFEKRIGRKVRKSDLTDAPINLYWPHLYHERLLRALVNRFGGRP